MKESDFKRQLKEKLYEMFPGCLISKFDENDIQGLPDILILYRDRWAALECKRAFNSSRRPNQSYYVEVLNDMSYAAFVSPENEEVILDDLQQALRPRRKARFSRG